MSLNIEQIRNGKAWVYAKYCKARFRNDWQRIEQQARTAKDIRGDGDIYDYCVDDPVNLVDAKGLAFTGSGNHEPVKMTLFETDERVGYWRTIPEEGACKKCLEMAKQRFTSRPDRPHPNCKCEIEFVKLAVNTDKVRENHSNSKRYEYENKDPLVYVVGQRPLDSAAVAFFWDKRSQ